MLEVKKITKKFGNFKALDEISFKIDKGEVVGLLGPNGAGKTTCMRVITGYYYPESGAVEIDTLTFSKFSNKIKSKIGYLPENNPLYQNLTVKEYLNYVGQLKGLDKSLPELIRDVVKKTGIKTVYQKEISTLSKGFKQRVGLAQALLGDPEILILDEPTEGLDPNQREDIRNLIKKYGKNKTIIISSHVLAEVQKVCDRVIIISKGKVVKDSKIKDLEFGESAELTINVKGKSVLSSLKGIKGADSVSKNGDTYLVVSKKGKDLRAEITKLSAKNKWDLYEIYLKKKNLEDVFKQLTN